MLPGNYDLVRNGGLWDSVWKRAGGYITVFSELTCCGQERSGEYPLQSSRKQYFAFLP